MALLDEMDKDMNGIAADNAEDITHVGRVRFAVDWARDAINHLLASANRPAKLPLVVIILL